MKLLAVCWLLLCITARNKTPGSEIFSIMHSLLAAYIVWGTFTGVWALPWQWEIIGVASQDNNTVIYGWALWAGSLLAGLFWLRDYRYRFDYLSEASFFSTHRQVGYVLAFFGVWLLYYSGASGKSIPFYMTFTLLVLAIGNYDDVAPSDNRR